MPRPPQRILSWGNTVVEPVVDGRMGEWSVSVHNTSDRAVAGCLSLRDSGSATAPWFHITPPGEHGGYFLREIRPGDRLDRHFSLRPVNAEVGKSYRVRVLFEPLVDDAEGRTRLAAPVTLGEFEVSVRARPEVYAAIGAVEKLRQRLHAGYRECIAEGEKAQGRTASMLPSSPDDHIEVPLREQSFDFLLRALDLGLRVVQAPARRRSSTGGSGGDSNGTASP